MKKLRLKNRRLLVVVLIILFILLAGGSVGFVLTRSNNDEVGNLQIFKGATQVISDGKSINGVTGTPIHLNDEIKVAQGGIAAVILKDTTVVRLEGGSDANVADMTYQSGKIKDGVIKLKSGRAWSRVQHLQKDSNFAVETPTVTAAVRGTSFNTTFQGQTTGIYVYHHKVQVTLTATGGQKYVQQTQLLQMQQGSLKTDFDKGPTLPPYGFFDDWIKFNQAQDDLLCQQRHDIPEDCGDKVESLTQPQETATTPPPAPEPTPPSSPNPAPSHTSPAPTIDPNGIKSIVITGCPLSDTTSGISYYQCNAKLTLNNGQTSDITTTPYTTWSIQQPPAYAYASIDPSSGFYTRYVFSSAPPNPNSILVTYKGITSSPYLL